MNLKMEYVSLLLKIANFSVIKVFVLDVKEVIFWHKIKNVSNFLNIVRL